MIGNHTIGFIGYGNMGDAIGQSILKSGHSVYVTETNEDRQNWIASQRPDITLVTIDQLVEHCSIIFLAIKPQQFSLLSQSTSI